ncbi:hypothetical protein B9Z55_028080 [Caenorhabditis nigoni]|uniref:Homeobox domain-containing protein n=1 Tax=Caenorhabditis nigoni TaxID=1611254 RepID=A0A2G5SD49_9PELO|nr:hypothetical protein B9Z55_028080 [Caenorhabditis nigoni]
MRHSQQNSQPPDPNYTAPSHVSMPQRNLPAKRRKYLDTSPETSNMAEYNGQCSSSSMSQQTNEYYSSSSSSENESDSEYQVEEEPKPKRTPSKRQGSPKTKTTKKKKRITKEQEERLERQRRMDENAVDVIKVILRENPHFSNYSDEALIARTGWSKTKIGNFIRAIRKEIYANIPKPPRRPQRVVHQLTEHQINILENLFLTKKFIDKSDIDENLERTLDLPIATIAAWFSEQRVSLMRRYARGMLPTLPSPLHILEQAYNKYPFIESQKQIAELYISTNLLETFVIQFFKERRMIDRETGGNAVLNKHDKKNSKKWKDSNETDSEVGEDETPNSPQEDANQEKEDAESNVEERLEYDDIVDADAIIVDEEVIIDEEIIDEEEIYEVDELFEDELIAEYREIGYDIEEEEDDELPAVHFNEVPDDILATSQASEIPSNHFVPYRNFVYNPPQEAVLPGPDAHPSWHNFVNIGEDRGDTNSRRETVTAAPL